MPRLSVIICIYDMPREAPRTILSAARPYQKGVRADDYEVIVVDNGSKRKLSERDRLALPPEVVLVAAPDPKPSPVFAINWAAREVATGDRLLFAIDGARLFSDRLYESVLAVLDERADAFVYTLAWHLGPKAQMISTREGYDENVEDRLIAASGWPQDPDALWDVAAFAGSSAPGFFGKISESNAFALSRRAFDEFGGYDERFVSSGGGLTNLELFARYTTRPNAYNVCLLSEGTFHQTHGGVATSGKIGFDVFASEYRAIFDCDYQAPAYSTVYRGAIRPKARRFASAAVGFGLK